MKKTLFALSFLLFGVLCAQEPSQACPFCPGPDQTDVYAIPLDEDENEVELELDEFNGPRSNNRDSALTK